MALPRLGGGDLLFTNASHRTFTKEMSCILDVFSEAGILFTKPTFG